MSLDTFANLKTAIADWLWRANDTDLTTYIPDFITLAEAEMNRRIQTRRRVAREDFTIDSEFEDVPSDFSSVVAFRLSSTDPDSRLKYVSPDTAAEMIGSTYADATGQPKYYTIVGGSFQFIPAPAGTYTGKLTYREKIPALTISNTSNWVLTDHPDVYLYGSLIHAAPFLKNDDRVAVWGALHERALQSLAVHDSASNFGGVVNARSARVFG